MSGTVVLCGSLGSASSIWDPQLPALAGKRVVRVDHPGHGDAPLVAFADVADLADRVLERVGDGTFSFIGLSLGGAIGMQLALVAPDRLDRLVLACTAARFGEPEQWRERAALVRAEGLMAIVEDVLARWFTAGFDDVARYREMMLAVDPEGYARCCEALALWDVGEALAAVRTPTLVIAGADDPTTPPATLELVATAIPGARLAVIDHAAHIAAVERAAEFNQLIEGHL
jgi:3-oxoadipate enol-lactonase